MALESDQRIANRYRLGERLGSGGMGAVYCAFDEIIGENVALKVLHDDDPELFARFKQEMVLARKVTHRNIARTFDIGLDGRRPFLTMELVEGESLKARCRRGETLLAETAAIVSQVASGLAAAHEASVIHQDLKPGNILLGVGGRVVVIDFGVAAVFDPMAVSTNELVGTFDYMAPEQVEGGAPRPASDVYALGLITYEMLTRQRAFEGETPHTRALLRLDQSAPSLVGVRDVPRDVAALVASCLALAPDRRPTAEAVARAFNAYAKPLSPTASTNEPEDPEDFAEPTLISTATNRPKLVRVFAFTSAGPSARAWDVGATLAEEVTDLLSRTKGIHVLATKESARGREGAVPDLVVIGSVQDTDGVFSITARLVDDKSGDQLWAGRFQGFDEQLLEMGGRLAGQIAEALRLELEVLPYDANVPAEAIELYLRARRVIRSAVAPPSEAVHLLDRCLAIAPGFSVAVAARAVAIGRSYFLADFGAGDLSLEGPRAVGRALEEAPLLPDTQLAVGLVALQQGHYSIAVQAFEKAVAMAPTHALALEQLGRLEIEAGRGAQGLARLKFAATLNPNRRSCLFPVARAYALRGNIEAFDREMDQIRLIEEVGIVEEISLEARVSNWTNNTARARAVRARAERLTLDEGAKSIVLFAIRMAAGEPVEAEYRASMEVFFKMPASPRLRAVINQVAAENFARRDPLIATQYLLAALAQPLVDIEWIELCCALDPLRSLPAFEAARSTVQARIRTMWGESS